MQITSNKFYDIQYIICQNNVFLSFLAVLSPFQPVFKPALGQIWQKTQKMNQLINRTESEKPFGITLITCNQHRFILN